MSELTENIRQELKDRETRFIYDDDLLNTYIATQIRTLREQRDWTQQKLAEEAGMKQERISVLEDVNYSSWTAKVLRRLAQAFDLRLTIKFEEYNTFFKDFEGVKPESLKRRSFEDDPAFKDAPAEEDKEPEQVETAVLERTTPARHLRLVSTTTGTYQPAFRFGAKLKSISAGQTPVARPVRTNVPQTSDARLVKKIGGMHNG